MIWCLKHNPASWDFMVSAMIGINAGEKTVNFVLTEPLHSLKWNQEITWRRVRRLLIPVAELLGLSWAIVRTPPQTDLGTPSWHYGELNKIAADNPKVFRLINPAIPRERDYMTITLRNSQLSMPGRNSDLVAWHEFAEFLRLEEGETVKVIEDDEENPLSPKERLKLYAGSKMNWSIATGPMALCHFSTCIPYTTFITSNDSEGSQRQRAYHEKKGFWGKQLVFARQDQRLIWKNDTFDNLKAEYTAWKETHAVTCL